jgi:multiple sugar transport system permease protein
MAGIPSLIVVSLVWVPALGTVVLSFTDWDFFSSLREAKNVGLQNYEDVVTTYPPFKPALQHNLIWLAFFFLVPTPLGMYMAVLLDRELRGSRIYETAFFMPVVLSLALTGFIWQLIYSRTRDC